jgi:hypothetical protein
MEDFLDKSKKEDALKEPPKAQSKSIISKV